MKAAITSQGGQSASHEGWGGQGKKGGHGVTSSSRRSPREDYSVTRNGKKRLPTNTILSDSFSLLQLFYPWLPRPLLSVFPFVLPFFFLPSRSGPFGKCSKVNIFFKLVFFFLSPNLGYTVCFEWGCLALHSSLRSIHCIALLPLAKDLPLWIRPVTLQFFFCVCFSGVLVPNKGHSLSSPPWPAAAHTGGPSVARGGGSVHREAWLAL